MAERDALIIPISSIWLDWFRDTIFYAKKSHNAEINIRRKYDTYVPRYEGILIAYRLCLIGIIRQLDEVLFIFLILPD